MRYMYWLIHSTQKYLSITYTKCLVRCWGPIEIQIQEFHFIIYLLIYFLKLKKFFNVYLFLRDRDRVLAGGGAERERDTQSPK